MGGFLPPAYGQYSPDVRTAAPRGTWIAEVIMATERNKGSQKSDEMELEGTTEEGIEFEASMDDDEDESSGKGGNPGSFAKDRERASEAGRKGGRN